MLTFLKPSFEWVNFRGLVLLLKLWASGRTTESELAQKPGLELEQELK